MIKQAAPDIDLETQNYYFTRLQQLERSGLVKWYRRGFLTPEPADVDIVDIPSLRDISTRRLAISALLAAEIARGQRMWRGKLSVDNPELEDNRAPTYIVIDEAHHLAPRGEGLPAGALVVRDQIRTIAGEGRKYGLFLILVSQRPDKIDELVLSECNNRAVLKHDSPERFREALDGLGIKDAAADHLRVMEQEKKKGMVLLSGPWAVHKDGTETFNSRLYYTAARRTVEGGRDLQWKLWAVERQAAKDRFPEVDPDGDPPAPGPTDDPATGEP